VFCVSLGFDGSEDTRTLRRSHRSRRSRRARGDWVCNLSPGLAGHRGSLALQGQRTAVADGILNAVEAEVRVVRAQAPPLALAAPEEHLRLRRRRHRRSSGHDARRGSGALGSGCRWTVEKRLKLTLHPTDTRRLRLTLPGFASKSPAPPPTPQLRLNITGFASTSPASPPKTSPENHRLRLQITRLRLNITGFAAG
jgi:hypothetical protein